MRPFGRAILHAILWPTYVLGFFWYPVFAGFRFGQQWAQKAMDWLYKDAREKAVRDALEKARKMFPNATCRVEGEIIIVDHAETDKGVKH